MPEIKNCWLKGAHAELTADTVENMALKQKRTMPLLHEVLKQTAITYPDRAAFDSPEGIFTFTELMERIESTAGALEELRFRKGDRIAILAPNCIDYIVYHYASSMIGAILLVLNTRHTVDEWVYALDNAEAFALVIHKQFAEYTETIVSRCSSLRFSIGLGDTNTESYTHKDLLVPKKRARRPPKITEKDPVLLIYTSGTTGTPKGALQTHEGSVMADSLTTEALKITEKDVYLAFMPYFHQAGLIRTRAAMTRGGKNLITGKLDAHNMAECIAKKNVSITMLVPPYDTQLSEVIKNKEIIFPNLRFILGGGGFGPTHAKRMQEFCERTGCRYMGVYGQTEVTGTVVAIFDEDYFQKPGSCGKPLPGIDLQIWNDSCQPVGSNKVGEIMIRSSTCIPEYWRNKQASQALYTGEWLHTGDLGRLDDDGFLYFVDRKKELIKSGGENVYPKEVENILSTHPDIVESMVIGIPDINGWGELVAAVVVPNSEKNITVEEIKAFCQGKIAGYKIPKIIHCMRAIPRNFTGKPMKLQLKKELQEKCLITE